MKIKRNDERGYIVVETVGTFIPFVLLVVSILSLVNIITLQSRIHHALTQTALTISMYTYVLEKVGLADDLAILDEKAHEFGKSISSVGSGIEALTDDPDTMLKGLMNFGINELKSLAAAEMIKPLIMSYLKNGDTSAQLYLENVRVTEFNLTDCIIIDKNENVKLTVQYEVEYTFGALRLPFTPTLRLSQTVVTKAWLTGSGEGYRR
ncbi:MAG: hypothetical protein FWD44_05015 [Oscillospiraceae bacterium]|nr:hypothetical protein [Oscillospiraceae bacterium]